MSRNTRFLPRLLLAGAVAHLILAPAALAEDRWVTDEFEIMMRSGKSTKQRIIKQLKSGTQLELIQVDEERRGGNASTGDSEPELELTEDDLGVLRLSEDELIEFCANNMARFKRPKKVVFGELPKTATGKIQKNVLRERAREL